MNGFQKPLFANKSSFQFHLHILFLQFPVQCPTDFTSLSYSLFLPSILFLGHSEAEPVLVA